MSLVLHYDTNEHYLTNVHKQAISKYLELVNEDKRILVEGHTDDVGSQAYNKVYPFDVQAPPQSI